MGFSNTLYCAILRLCTGVIRAYQYVLSPDHSVWARVFFGGERRVCIYFPTCSTYAKEALERFGFVKGGLLAVRRIRRCHPYRTPQVDPVPEHEPAFPPQNCKKRSERIE